MTDMAQLQEDILEFVKYAVTTQQADSNSLNDFLGWLTREEE